MSDTDRIQREIAAFEAMKPQLEEHHKGKWVVIFEGELRGTYDTLDNAATFARQAYGRGPYLIRQVGAPPAHLPASVMFRPVVELAGS